MAQWEDVNGDGEACGLAADYANACCTLGRSVRVSMLDGADVSGRAVRIASDGRLLVEVDGELIAVGAGDVEHLRAAD
jgi:BirA family biotin operon repressor/biotin-[acetyl-CoA-carboxylase] ligase